MTIGVGARAFISYTRADNDDHLGVVDRLSTELAGRFAAATGRSLEVFVDREKIGWGEDWRASIRDSVRAATFFIPVVTMRYFQSDACREELFAFHENAKQLGVTDLIMPIVLAGSSAISRDDPRPEVQLVEGLNYKNIQDAWLAGYASPEWLQAVNWMVEQLASALTRAENELDERAESVVEVGAELTYSPEAIGDMSTLSEWFTELKTLMEEALADMLEFGRVSQVSLDGKDLKGLPPKQQQVQLLQLARALSLPSEKLATSSAALEARASGTDAQLRAIVEELRSIDADLANQQVASLVGAMAGIQALSSSVDQMKGFVQILRFAAVANVSLRKSLQPAIKGIQSVSNSLEIFDSWRSL